MKVENNNKVVSFKDIGAGKAFKSNTCNQDIYVKVHSNSSGYNAIDLNENSAVYFRDDATIHPVEAKVVIE